MGGGRRNSGARGPSRISPVNRRGTCRSTPSAGRARCTRSRRSPRRAVVALPRRWCSRCGCGRKSAPYTPSSCARPWGTLRTPCTRSSGATGRGRSRGSFARPAAARLLPLPARSKQPPRDDQLLDLVRPFVQTEDTGVSEVALDVEVPAEPIAAVDLDRAVADAHRHLGPEQLRHADLEGVVDALVPELGRPEREQACGIDLHRRLRDHLPDELERRDRSAERPAVLCILRRGLERRPRDADGARRDAETPAVQRLHRLLPTLPPRPPELIPPHPTVLEREGPPGGP